MHKNKLAFVTIVINIVIAVIILALGAFLYLFSRQESFIVPVQMRMVFGAGFLLCYVFSYCYMLTRSIETQIIGDVLFHANFPAFIHKHISVSVLFIWGMTLLLWGPVVWYSRNIDVISLNPIFLVAWVIIWIVFMRAADYAEQKEPQLVTNQQDDIRVYALLALLFCLFGYDFLLVVIKLARNNYILEELSLSNQIVRELIISGVGLLFILVIGIIYFRYSKKTKALLEKIEMENQIKQGQMYIKLISEKYTILQQYQHDYKKHLSYIQNLARCNEVEQIDLYISTIYDDLKNNVLIRLTGNQTLDLILSEKIYQARLKGIEFRVDYQLFENILEVAASDLCIIIGNLCDNALMAAENSETKEVAVIFYLKNQYYSIVEISNTCRKIPLMQNGIPVTTQAIEGHGYGVQIVISTVKKYGGECCFEYDDQRNSFKVKVLLPCDRKRKEGI